MIILKDAIENRNTTIFAMPQKVYTVWLWFGIEDKLQLRQCPDNFWITYTSGLVETTCIA